VRHEADPKVALARVLDLSPEEIQVREAAPQPRAKANTASNSLSSTTAMAGHEVRAYPACGKSGPLAAGKTA